MLSYRMLPFRLSPTQGILSLVLSLCVLVVVGIASARSTPFHLTLLYSGDERGQLQAHGCDEQRGGLDYRQTLLQSLYVRHDAVLNLHTGNILGPVDANGEFVYQIALEALSLMRYDVACIGPQDLGLPMDTLQMLQGNQAEIAFVCANLVGSGFRVQGSRFKVQGSAFPSYVVREVALDSVNSVRVAVVGLLSQRYEMEVQAYHPELTIAALDAVLTHLREELTQRSDVVVVLLHSSLNKAGALAQRFPWVDVFIVTEDTRDPTSNVPHAEPTMAVESMLVTSDSQGEAVGVLELGLNQERQIVSRRNQFVGVSEQLEPSAEISMLLELYNRLMEDDGLVSPASVPGDRAVHLVYFHKRGCDKCARASKLLRRLQAKYPDLAIEQRNVKGDPALLEAMGQLYGVPEIKRLTTPAVFVGDEYFLDELDEARLETALQRYLPTGVASRLPEATAKITDAQSEIVSRFHSLGVLTVAGAGLLDGVNPCAFATIVFFISYLSLVGRSRREMLMAGLAFASAVFVTYLLLGAGALKFLETVGSFSSVGKVVYLVAGMATLTLAVLSLVDAYKARQGRTKDITLQLPKSLKLRIHKVIRERTRCSGILAGALAIGFAVSALELVCTGQVYLPTLTFVAGVPGMRMHAFWYLLLYNVMFVVPLLVVFGFVYWGTTSMQVGGVLQRHLVAVKLGTAMLLFGLGIWLLFGLS